jgi:eukaryotic-like serine/threonine-protein kinase
MSATGSVPAGTRLGRYEIVSLLGQGGMGEVYTARDETLDRSVALKILPTHRTSDPDRVARFLREARASSALNHPSIVSVHDAGSEGNVHFLAMELIDGESLAHWSRKRRSSERIAEVMAQIADGLSRAHAAGIVHRDLKPENIMITRDGHAKIVDFGVAKLTERTSGRPHTGISTPTARVGTTAYMSPEQVEARPVDHRADVFAFGVVLYELLTGRNPFASSQYADTLHNIVHLDPPLADVQAQLRRVVRRCLEKDPERRYDSMKDVALDLRETSDEREVVRPRRAWLVAAIVMLIGAAAAWRIADRRPVPSLAAVPAPAPIMTRLTSSGRVDNAAISPDGRYVVYSARDRDQQALYVKQIATGTETQIAAPAPVYYFNLAVSSDGNYVLYSSATRKEANVASVYQLPLLGGVPRKIAHDTEFWFSVSPDGARVAFVRFNAVDRRFRLTAAAVDGSGEEVLVDSRYPESVAGPVWEPSGRSLTFISRRSGREQAGLWRIDTATRKVTSVPVPAFPGTGGYAWLPDGSGALVTVYDREQPPQVWFVPAGSTTGQKVTTDVSAYRSIAPTADSRSFVTVRDTTDSNIFTLTLNDPEQRLVPVTTGIGNRVGAGGVRWLNDGEVLYTGIEADMNTFYVAGVAGAGQRRVVHNMSVWNPSVSPDGTKIVFVAHRDGAQQVWMANADGTSPRKLVDADRADWPSFTADGRSVVYLTMGKSQYAWRLDLDGKSKPEQLTHVPTNRGSLSRDGRWLLCRLRSLTPGQPLWRTAIVPVNGSGEPRFFDAPRYGGTPILQWHPDGQSFVYLDDQDGVTNVWRQKIDGGAPQMLTSFGSGSIYAFDLSPDGRKLVLARGEPASDAVLIRNFR